jgi:hypothetical protein
MKMVESMPLGRYFLFVGGVLIALLFVVDLYMPPAAMEPLRDEPDTSVIRVHSRHEWPEKIVIDTTLPTIVPPPVVTADPAPNPAPPTRQPNDAFATTMADGPEAAPAPTRSARKSIQKRRIKLARTPAWPSMHAPPNSFRIALPGAW